MVETYDRAVAPAIEAYLSAATEGKLARTASKTRDPSWKDLCQHFCVNSV
jgi:hypothetical protein